MKYSISLITKSFNAIKNKFEDIIVICTLYVGYMHG